MNRIQTAFNSLHSVEIASEKTIHCSLNVAARQNESAAHVITMRRNDRMSVFFT